MKRTMKDSGIPWIGEVPKNWKIVKLKRVAKIQTGNTPNKTKQDEYYSDFQGIPWIRPDNLGELNPIHKTSLYLTNKGCKIGKIMPSNCVYICCIGSLGKVGYSDIVCSCNQQINALLFNKHMFWKFGYYLSIYQDKQYLSYSNGNILQIINSTSQGNIFCTLPPIDEQKKIANYLDGECAKIDEVLTKIKQSIEEYKKLKQSIITKAVTKGVRTNRKMKNSGIEWVGEIPQKWNSIKLKYCTYIRARLGWKGLKASEYVEKGFPLLSAFNIINDKLVFENLNFINQFRYEESPEIKLSINDILLVKDGSIGKCAIVDYLPMESTVNSSIAVISVINYIYPKYLYYYFLTKVFQKFIDRLKTGMGVLHLFQADLKEMKVLLPPLEEQKEIADYLDVKTAEIDSIISKKEQLLIEIENYKKSLIYEYVTGKKEVI